MHRIHLTPASTQHRLTETWELVGRIERAVDAGEIEALLLQVASSHGLSSLFAGWVPSLNQPLAPPEVAANILHDHEPGEWSKRYVEQDYIHRDPIVARLQHDLMPFSWRDAYASCSSDEDVKLINGEASSFGLRGGYVVPIALPGSLSLAFSFGGAARDFDPDGKLLIAFLTSVAAGHLVHLMGCRSRRGPRQLTGREIDCLSWAAVGKTDWEIAVIIGISRCTVIKHLASVREKLDASNKAHAIAMALRLKIIS